MPRCALTLKTPIINRPHRRKSTSLVTIIRRSSPTTKSSRAGLRASVVAKRYKVERPGFMKEATSNSFMVRVVACNDEKIPRRRCTTVQTCAVSNMERFKSCIVISEISNGTCDESRPVFNDSSVLHLHLLGSMFSSCRYCLWMITFFRMTDFCRSLQPRVSDSDGDVGLQDRQQDVQRRCPGSEGDSTCSVGNTRVP
jgi:hypothetical protein